MKNQDKLEEGNLFLEGNLRALKNSGLEIPRKDLDKILQESTGLEIVKTPSGAITAKYEGTFLHSPYDPLKEAKRLLEREIPDPNSGICIFQGFGLGYQVEAFLELNQEAKGIILEPDLELFIRLLRARDITELIENPRISFLLALPPQLVSRYLPEDYFGQVRIFKLRSLYLKDQTYYQEADRSIQNYLSRRDINRNTLKRFGRLWVRNLFYNLPYLEKAKPVSSLFGSLVGIPALVCAAGPSLDLVLPILDSLRERMVIFAVDTALKALTSRGIEPDFTVVVDPQYWNTRHLEGCNLSETALVSESSTHPRTFRFFPSLADELNLPALGEFLPQKNTTGSTVLYFCSSLFPLGQRFEQKLGSFGKLGAGGSVVTSAWDLARHLGCSPIFIAGLDLGYPGLQTHYRGSFFEERAQSHSNRYEPIETWSCRVLWNAQPFYCENNRGGKTLTDQRLNFYKTWFESQLRELPERTTFSLSPEGIKIEGMEYSDPSALPDLPIRREEINRILSDLKENAELGPAEVASKKRNTSRLKEILKELEKELEILKTLAERGISLLGKLKDLEPADSRPVLEELDSIDQRILSSGSRDLAGFLVQEISLEILKDNSKAEDLTEVLDKNERLYRALLEACEYHLRILLARGDRG